jgi:putative membrane protein
MTTVPERDLGDGDTPDGPPIRTYLANERTFLAWLRTGLASIALGAAAQQALDPDPLREVLAGGLIIFGLALCVLGRVRYRQLLDDIATGSYQPRPGVVDAVLAGMVVLGVAALAWIFSSQAG